MFLRGCSVLAPRAAPPYFVGFFARQIVVSLSSLGSAMMRPRSSSALIVLRLAESVRLTASSFSLRRISPASRLLDST
jgi:hypothetical protein